MSSKATEGVAWRDIASRGLRRNGGTEGGMEGGIEAWVGGGEAGDGEDNPGH